jgi:fluoroacetyl-CoA thioesterase
MKNPNPPVGLRHTQSVAVDAGLTVPNVSTAFGSFQDMPPVFATAFMVGFVEATCIEALRPHLAEGQHTVGIHVDLSHRAATPIGMTVTAEVELVAAEGRRLRFKVECRDEAETIGSGFHDRAIIDSAKFLARVEYKRRKS